MSDKEEDSSIDIGRNLTNCFFIGEEGLSGLRGRTRLSNAEHLSHRGIVPETRLKKALLHDNAGDERRLSRDLEKLSAHRRRALFSNVRSSRAFQASQHRKKETWKREDRDRLARINIPVLRAAAQPKPQPALPRSGKSSQDDSERRRSHDAGALASVERMYTSPCYSGRPRLYVPILPVMVLRSDSIEIVRHREQTFVSRMPSIVTVPSQRLNSYDRYRGKKYLECGEAARDERFVALTQSLSVTDGRQAALDRLLARSKTVA